MIWTKTRGACLAVGLAALTMAGSAWAQPTPFTCEGELYHLTAGSQYNHPTQVYRLNANYTHPSTPFATRDQASLNGLAFNPQDGFLYAVNDYRPLSIFRLYRLGSNGQWQYTSIASQLTSDQEGEFREGRTSGAFDAQGNLFIADRVPTRPAGQTQRLYLVTGAAAWAPQVRRVGIVGDDAPPPGYTSSGTMDVGDFAYNHSESSASTAVLYGTRLRDTASGVSYLYRINVDLAATPLTAKVSRRTISGLPAAELTYGAAYIDQQGELLISANNNAVYHIDHTTGVATRVAAANGTPHSNTDGTSCRALPHIDVVKAAGTPQAVNDHTFDVPYTLKVGNTGKVSAPNVQISENLSATFNAGGPGLSIVGTPPVTVSAGSCTANPTFNGTTDFRLLSGTNTLAAGASCTITFTVRVAYPNAAAVPAGAQNNTAWASSTNEPNNNGHAWPGGPTAPPQPPAHVVAQDESNNGTSLPDQPNSDTPVPTPVALPPGQVTFEKTITSSHNPSPGDIVEYTITVRNSGLVSMEFPPGSIVDNLPDHTAHAGGDAFTCTVSSCTNTDPVIVPANGHETLAFRVIVKASAAGGTEIVNTIAPPAGTRCASPTACEAKTSPVVIPLSDMSVAINGLPSVVSPGATVDGQIVCTNAGPGFALNATCTATGVDNNGDPIGLTVGACTPLTPVDFLPVGDTITCAISYTAPGTAGGSDTPQTSVTVTATTGASNESNTANNEASRTADIIDAVDDAVSGRLAGAQGETYNVAGNDQFPTGSTFTLGSGSTCANPAMSPAGEATFDVPSDGSSCTVVYQVCAPASTTCDTAVLTVTPAPRATDDTRSREPGNTPTVVPVLDNDPDGGAAALDSVELADPSGVGTLAADKKTLTVPGEGTWTVTGNTVTFTPEDGFTGAPTPIGYTFANNDGVRSNVASITLNAAAGPGAVTPVPTLSQWSLMLLAALLGAAGLRRRVGSC